MIPSLLTHTPSQETLAQQRKIVIIIPAYNEEACIGNVIAQIRELIPFADIVVVNDGSTDETSRIANEMGVELLSLPYNSGIGVAMQTGYMFAHERGYDAAIQIDGDGQHNPRDIINLLIPLWENKADVVIGSRFIEQKGDQSSLPRRLGGKLLSLFIYTITGESMTDPTSGFRSANRKAIEFYARHYPSDYPEPEAIVLLSRHQFRMIEVKTTMNSRQGGKSSITFLRAWYYMIKVSLAILLDALRR
ncbi:MAG: glycosyltransferase family 2 protein [Candidatus Tectomicrobia bacterium]|nr:glycosyltransferase family 2 protein [Candidatus Tectomicrobia bacterium]